MFNKGRWLRLRSEVSKTNRLPAGSTSHVFRLSANKWGRMMSSVKSHPPNLPEDMKIGSSCKMTEQLVCSA